MDNVVVALEHNDRICKIHLCHTLSLGFEKAVAAMQQPFPELTCLELWLDDKTAALVVPASFLGGSAPQLQSLSLHGIAFPALPELLLSATHLVELELWDIPRSGYFSPEAMVTGLSALTKLESLHIESNPQWRPDQKCRLPPQLTRTLLPVLTVLVLKMAVEYLEDFVARIDAPLLHHPDITFFDPPPVDTPQLTQFMSLTTDIR
jgi:hypothetical protein